MQIAAELTSKLVEELILELNDETDRDPLTLLEWAEMHDARPLLASAWQSEGADLSPGLAHEVALFRERAAGHRRLFDELSSAVGGIEAVKGFRIAELYPSGWVRGGKDLDVRATTQETVWRVVRYLLDRGWQCGGAFLQRIGREDVMSVVLTSTSLDPMVLRPEAVEVGPTVFAPGNFFGLGPLATHELDEPLPPLVSHFLGILEQRLERGVTVRDVVDSVVLLQAMSTSDLDDLWRIVDRLLLWKELGEVAFVLDTLELVPQDALLPARFAPQQQRARQARTVRALQRAATVPVLARYVAHKAATAQWKGNLAQDVAARLPRVVPAMRVLAAGLPLVGAPIAREVTSDGLRLDVVEGNLVATCPAGAFLLLYGREYDEQVAARVRAHLGQPAG